MMTIDERRELTAKLLCRFFGWQWKRDIKRDLCTFHPPYPKDPDSPGWQPSPMLVHPEDEPKHYETLSTVPPPDRRFHDWYEGCWYIDTDGHAASCGMPRLTDSLDACAMLKTALLAKGLGVSILCYAVNSNRVIVEAEIINENGDTVASHSIAAEAYAVENEALTICMAADGIA